jgi:hypothetical protein
MNPESVSSKYTDEAQTPEVLEVNTPETQLLLPPSSSTQSSDAQWQQYGERIAEFLQSLPTYVSRFFTENKGPLGTIGLILATIVTIKLTLALVDAIDDIPLVAPTLELIGLVYTLWFVYRYLLRAATRKELSEEIKTLKDQVFGTGS